MGLNHSPLIVTNGLRQYLDAGNTKSYDSRMNLFTYSEDFSNANWTKISTTITSNAITGPTVNGVVLNADKIVETAVTTQFLVSQNPYTAAIGDVNTISVYAKAGERTQLTITSYAEGYSVFNLDTGTIYSTGGNTCSIESLGNGWYRCRATITETEATASNWYIGMWKSNTNVYLGTVGQGLYVAGAQFEKNRTFLSSYIKTTASAVTASTAWNDLIDGYNATLSTPVFTPTANGSLLFNGTSDYASCGNLGTFTPQGTISVWFNSSSVINYRTIACTQFDGLDSGIRIEQTGASTVRAYIGDGTNLSSELSFGTITAGDWYKLDLTWNAASNTVIGYLNGAQVFSTSNSIWPSTLPSLTLGVGYSSAISYRYFQGNISQLMVYNEMLSPDAVAINYNAIKGRYGL